MSRVAGILTNLVPYHHARWQAFAQSSQSSQSSCVVLELTNKDEFAVLEVPPAAGSTYERITLFPKRFLSDLSAADISTTVARALDQQRPDCVCVNGYASPHALGALSWAANHRVPVVVMSESTTWDEARRGWKEWIKSRVIHLCSSALVGGSPHADYMAQLGMPRERIFTGYDAVDNDYFERGAAQARSQSGEMRQKLGLPETYFLASARFAPKKNLSRLIQAYARYRKLAETSVTAIPWELVIVGDGAAREALLGECADLGVREYVHLVGAKSYSELPVYYGLASAFIHASTTEQWGLVVNEAMASGLPVLVSNRCGCAPDLVQEGVNGFTFDPLSVEDMAQRMSQLVASPQLASFDRASGELIAAWSPRKFADELTRAIAVALSNQPPALTSFDRLLLSLLIRR
jgi:glycosyltransferase involved in cell wall biosynthesis